MNRKYLIPALASVLVLSMVLSSFTPAMAQPPVIAPKLDVVTIPQDDQVREKGIMILGLDTNQGGSLDGFVAACEIPEVAGSPDPHLDDPGVPNCGFMDLLSQHKLVVSYNGQLLYWSIGTPALVVTCNVLEKDKVNPVPDKFGDPTYQFPEENLKTKLIDVSDKFICKPRWKSPADMPGHEESVGVLDVYYVGPYEATMLADNILVVTVSLVIGRTIVVGTDMQDICVIGWGLGNRRLITLPNGGDVYQTWANAMGDYVSCEELTLVQRDAVGIAPQGVEN